MRSVVSPVSMQTCGRRAERALTSSRSSCTSTRGPSCSAAADTSDTENGLSSSCDMAVVQMEQDSGLDEFCHKCLLYTQAEWNRGRLQQMQSVPRLSVRCNCPKPNLPVVKVTVVRQECQLCGPGFRTSSKQCRDELQKYPGFSVQSVRFSASGMRSKRDGLRKENAAQTTAAGGSCTGRIRSGRRDWSDSTLRDCHTVRMSSKA